MRFALMNQINLIESYERLTSSPARNGYISSDRIRLLQHYVEAVRQLIIYYSRLSQMIILFIDIALALINCIAIFSRDATDRHTERERKDTQTDRQDRQTDRRGKSWSLSRGELFTFTF